MGHSNSILPEPITERVRQLSDETLVVALEAFREGRKVGGAQISDELSAFLEQLFAELETGYGIASGEVKRFEGTYEGAQPSPVVAAHFGGASDVLARVRSRLRQLAEEEDGG